MSSNRGHRAGQCAPEVPRTRIRARGDLQERRIRPGNSLITHRILAPQPGDSLIRLRCARLLAKPESFSPLDEVCCWPGCRGAEPSGSKSDQGAPDCWPGRRGAEPSGRCCLPGRRGGEPSGRCCWPGRCGGASAERRHCGGEAVRKSCRSAGNALCGDDYSPALRRSAFSATWSWSITS